MSQVDSDMDQSVWADVIGQDAAVEALRGAAERPVHAYLLVGKPGWGTSAAALAFAAELLSADTVLLEADAGGDVARRVVDLARRNQHPDLHWFGVQGAALRDEEAEEIVVAAARAPVESARKVLVLEEFHKAELMGPKLLKTIEEPSASTIFVILADEVPEGLVTIASRAVRVDFGPIPTSVLATRLSAEGFDPSEAADVAQAAGGDLHRARLLASDERLILRRDAWRDAPRRLDGTGAVAWDIAGELLAHIDDSQAALDARQETETEALREQIETYGQRTTPLKQLADRHKREIRRHRTDELRFGLATMAGTYRDFLTETSRPGPILDALDAIGDAAEALVRNPNETLLLQALLARLPAIR